MPNETLSEVNNWSTAFRCAFNRIGTKAFALLISAFMIIAGSIMICLGLKGDGVIDVHAAIVDGHLKTGSVGIALIFLSTIIVSLCVIMRSRSSTLEINQGRIKWTGVPNHIDHATIRELAKEMKHGSS